MGLFSQNCCPDIACKWQGTGKKGEKCFVCGKELTEFGFLEFGEQMEAKKRYKVTPSHIRTPESHKRPEPVNTNYNSKKYLFSPTMSDDQIKNLIFTDMENIANQEAGTKWMRVGTLLSFDSTQQIIGAGFKALIDQNKLIIRQNELILRELKKLNTGSVTSDKEQKNMPPISRFNVPKIDEV